MKREALAEIHFHGEDSASCIVRVTSTGDSAVADELLLWACFANRQLNNMGHDAASLASLLSNMSGELNELYKYDGVGPKLLQEHQGRSRRRFECHLAARNDLFRFRLKVRGFGLFGKRLSYYCPTSVILLLRHLAWRRRDNQKFITSLERLAEVTGTEYLAGEVNMLNADNKAYLHVVASLPEKTDEMIEEK